MFRIGITHNEESRVKPRRKCSWTAFPTALWQLYNFKNVYIYIYILYIIMYILYYFFFQEKTCGTCATDIRGLPAEAAAGRSAVRLSSPVFAQ